jgi:glucose/mannose transport system permease protein
MSAQPVPLAAPGGKPTGLTLSRLILYTLLVVFALFFLVPLYVGIMTSLKTMGEVTRTNIWTPPTAPTLENYRLAWDVLSTSFLNSVYLSIPVVIISSILGSLNGYVLSKWKFRGSNLIFALILFGMFIPYQAILIPLVQFLQTIGLYGTIPGLMLVHIIYGIPITTLIFRNYYVAIPEELVEASKVDGASFFGIYRHILLPLSVPGFVVVLIWQFTSAWNDFLFGSLLTRQSNWPITVAVNNLAGSFQVAWNVQMAGALIAAIPTLLIYVLLGRFFMRGLLAGSLKG